MYTPTIVCEMCDKEKSELLPKNGVTHGWCFLCEQLFIQVMQLIRCAHRTKECSNPYACLNAKRCMQVRAVTITSSQVYETRERLRAYSARNALGVIAARTKIPEFALRDWIDNPSHFITQQEMLYVIEALDRDIPQQSAAKRTTTV
jgi:hypothetical protein